MSDEPESETPVFGERSERYPMGVGELDKEVLRGIPKGSVISVIGDPNSRAELLLHSLVATGRRAEYVSVSRKKQQVKPDILRVAKSLDTHDYIRSNIESNDINIHCPRTKDESVSDVVEDSLDKVQNGNFVLDSMSALRLRTDISTVELSEKIYDNISEENGLSYIYFNAQGVSDLSNEEKEILNISDGIFTVNTTIENGDQVINQMIINKLRGCDYPSEVQKLEFGMGISIDATGAI
jgi:KaiC/GvpD/RAD55 family RecA-like ATPase